MVRWPVSYGILCTSVPSYYTEIGHCNMCYHCYTAQVVRAPAYHVFLDIVQEDGPEPSIPCSETVQALDASLIRTHEFLISRKRPTDLSDHEFAVFVHHAVCFFVLEGNLWHREPHGRHQLVAQCQDRTLGLSDLKGFGLSSYAVPLSRVLPRISRVQR
jgi:hypothetical protein